MLVLELNAGCRPFSLLMCRNVWFISSFFRTNILSWKFNLCLLRKLAVDGTFKVFLSKNYTYGCRRALFSPESLRGTFSLKGFSVQVESPA